MKPHLLFCWLLPLAACTDSPTPAPDLAVITYRFQLFEGASEQDWFRPGGPGHADSIRFSIQGNNGKMYTGAPPIERDGSSVYFGKLVEMHEEPQPPGAAAYINVIQVRLSSKDVDTIRIEAYNYPAKQYSRLRFLYNGQPCADYDLSKQPQVREQFYNARVGGQVVPLYKFTKH